MAVAEHERRILRDLARRLAAHAANPRNAQLIGLWKRHNRLERVKPMVLVFPEGAWEEILPPDRLETTDPLARSLERDLRSRVYHAEHFRDDVVTDDEVRVPLVRSTTGWGLEAGRIAATEERGAWAFDPPLKDPADISKLHFPDLLLDEDATRRNFEQVQELVGDLLKVRVYRSALEWNPASLVMTLTGLRGIDQLMLDMCDRPEWVHEIMSFLAEGQARLLEQMEAMGALEVMNGNHYAGSGGFAWTDELPAPGYQGKARLQDCWGFAEAQELAVVSPAMLDEFVLPYQARLLGRFGLACYGCCESITHKLPFILRRIPNIRRVSVSPWTDIRIAADILQDRYIFSWKPNPSEMMVTFDPAHIRRKVEETVAAAKDCVLEMILKDTHTVGGQPERLEAWVDIAQQAAAGERPARGV